MKLRIGSLTRSSAMCLLLGLACAGRADADQTLTLSGFNHETINFTSHGVSYGVSGGNIVPNTLNGSPLSYLYCVQYNVEVYVPGTYDHTIVNSTGKVGGNQGLLTNVGEVSWLLTNLAAGAITLDQQAGLQAAIWFEVTGGSANNGFVFGSNTQGITDAYNAALVALGVMDTPGHITLTNGNDDGHGHFAKTASVSNLLYITPSTDGSTYQQALVTVANPEPSTAVMAATGGIVIAGCFWRRRRAKAERTPLAGG